VVVKKETTAALIQKQQARQQAGLAIVYERELALERAVAKRGQENAEQSTVKSLLADEVAALTKIYEPIKDRAGEGDPCERESDGATHYTVGSVQ
jgi:hypothetical protein